VDEKDDRACDQGHEPHPKKRAAMIGEERLGTLGLAHEVDDLAEKREERDLYQRAEQTDCEQGEKERPNLANEIPIEGVKIFWRAFYRPLAKGIDEPFEPAEEPADGLGHEHLQIIGHGA